MAYKQNNPLSRTSSSPLFRKQGVSPINNRRLDPKLDPRKNSISRKSSSPLNAYPTAGSKASSIEEAYELAPLPRGERYVDMDENAAPGDVRFDAVLDLDKAFGGLDVEGDTSQVLKNNQIRPTNWNGQEYVPSFTNRQGYGLKTIKDNYDFGDYINHPFGFMNTGYGLSDDGSFNHSDAGSVIFGNTNRSFPVRGSGSSGEGDLTVNFDENLMLQDRPSFNPYTQQQDYAVWTPDKILTDSSAHGGIGSSTTWHSPTGFSPEGLSTPQHRKAGPAQIFANTLGTGTPGIDQFRLGETPMLGLGDFRNQFAESKFTGNPWIQGSSINKNAAINKVEIPNALSLYSNIDPNSMFKSGGGNMNLEYTDQFKTDYPKWLAGGLNLDQGPTWKAGRGSTVQAYDPSTNMFGEGTFTSSRFAPQKVDGKRTGRIGVDNPMTVAGEMVRSGEWTMNDFNNYLDLIKSNYGRGNVAGQNPPRQ